MIVLKKSVADQTLDIQILNDMSRKAGAPSAMEFARTRARPWVTGR